MPALHIRPQSRSLILLTLFFLLAAIFPAGVVLAGPGDISIVINGQPLNLDAPPLLQGGRLLAPVRPLAAALQARVTWNEATNSVIITTAKTTIVLEPGTKKAVQDGKRVSLDVPVQHGSNDRIMVPLRFLAESLGAAVAWDAQNLTATITTPWVTATGRLVVSDVEGRHFELETGQGRLVLLPEEGSTGIAKDLEKYAGQMVIVVGTMTNEPNIYMRGPIMRVNSVSPVQSPTPAGSGEETYMLALLPSPSPHPTWWSRGRT
ncbi:copper amine oxidase N-terminal domain-containing protein [Moorella naiadis]|uniref:copper amine oxidase N-terminal domain-containing protein n=1 Tax=Moorella naiadis (nom. illeg.) TaxID=3093670 RepID=UPI003D9C851D